MRTLIIGLGSIGERHLTVLQSLGYRDLAVLRSRNLPPRTVDPSTFETFTTWEDAIAWGPQAAIICTPTSQHAAETVRCLENGWHVLAEKPLAAQPDELPAIRRTLEARPGCQLRVAYMLPFFPHMERVRAMIASQELGRLVSMATYWGEFLPDWHPWEDYRTSYAALKSLGGGAALTLSHDVDLCCQLAQSPVKTWFRLENRASDLEIDTDAASDISLGFENGITAHCHLSMADPVPRRHYRFVFTQGVAEIDYLAGRLTLIRHKGEPEMHSLEGWERNDMFRAQWQEFEAQIQRNDPKEALAQVEASEVVMRICAG